MENPSILMSLNRYLTIKSAARLRAVSKATKYYIDVKKFNYYPMLKRLTFTKIDFLKMIIRTDPEWLKLDSNAIRFHDINFHKHGKNIKEYVSKLYSYKFCIKFISKKLNLLSASVKEYVYDHCIDFVRHFTMCGIFSQLCIEKYKIN